MLSQFVAGRKPMKVADTERALDIEHDLDGERALDGEGDSLSDRKRLGATVERLDASRRDPSSGGLSMLENKP